LAHNLARSWSQLLAKALAKLFSHKIQIYLHFYLAIIMFVYLLLWLRWPKVKVPEDTEMFVSNPIWSEEKMGVWWVRYHLDMLMYVYMDGFGKFIKATA